jgi:hypothetical protein
MSVGVGLSKNLWKLESYANLQLAVGVYERKVSVLKR